MRSADQRNSSYPLCLSQVNNFELSIIIFDEFYGSAILNANVINYTDPRLDGPRHERDHSRPGRPKPCQIELAQANHMLYALGNP